MYMDCESIVFDGETYWDCLEFAYVGPQTREDASTSGYSSSETDELKPDLQDLAFEELGETPELRQTSLNELRMWLLGQEHLRSCYSQNSPLRLDLQGYESDNFLLRFLRIQKFDVRKSSKMLEKYFEMRCDKPQWFMDIDPSTDIHLQELVKSGYCFVLPERDSEGRRVIFNYAQAFDAYRHTSSDIMKAFISTLEILLMDPENQIRGFTYVFYCKGLTFTQCSVWTPSDAATMFTSCEKNLPIRHKSINLLHLPFGMRTVFEFAKSFLSAKIKNRIVTLNDDKKLACRLGNEKILPQEFGGQVPLAEMTSLWLKELCDNRAKLEALDSLIINKEPETPCVFKTPVKATPKKNHEKKIFQY